MHLLRISRWATSLLLFAGLALGAETSAAQSSPEEDLMSLEIEDLARIKVFSASRHLEDTRKAPAAFSIITRDEIDRYGWRTLADLLRSVRGFYTAYDRNYTYLGVRGFLQSGDYNARILLLINGHRINENVYDSALLGTEFPLDIDLIDHVEVVRGASSSVFGTNGELGVINVVTRRPREPLALEVAGNTGSFMERQGRATGSFEKGRLSGLISGSMYRSQGASPLFFSEFASSATDNGVAENMDGDSSSQFFADVQRGKLRLQGLYGRRRKQIPTASYGTRFNDPSNWTSDTRAYLDVSYSWELGTRTVLDVRSYYDAYRFLGSYAYGAPGAYGSSVQMNDATADWTGVEAVLGRKLGRHRLVLGSSAEYNLRIAQKNYYLRQSPFLDDNERPWLLAGFGELELTLTPKFTMNTGGRIDHYNLFGTSLSPRVALVYLPSRRTSLKYVFGRGFRAPDAYDTYYVDQMDITAPNRHLGPENIESQSLTLQQDVLSWLGLTVDGFLNNLDHVIEQRADPATGDSHFINGAGDRGRGVELELEAKRASGWAARASYTFAEATDTDTNAAELNAPLQLAKLNATVPLRQRGYIGVELFYASSQKNYLGRRVPSSLLTNLTFSTKPLWGGWQFSASCYNLFNQSWATPTGPELTQAAVPQDGRTFRFKMAFTLPIRSQSRK